MNDLMRRLFTGRSTPLRNFFYAGREGKGRQPQNVWICRAGLRDGRLLFCGLAARRSARPATCLRFGLRERMNVAGIKLITRDAAPLKFCRGKALSADSPVAKPERFAANGTFSASFGVHRRLRRGRRFTLRPILACCAKSQNTISLAVDELQEFFRAGDADEIVVATDTALAVEG